MEYNFLSIAYNAINLNHTACNACRETLVCCFIKFSMNSHFDNYKIVQILKIYQISKHITTAAQLTSNPEVGDTIFKLAS